MEVKSVTVMMMVDDTARADVSITPARTYYRFATDSSIEDGELAAVDDFGATAEAITAAAGIPGAALPAGVRLQVFVNNRLHGGPSSEDALRRIVDILEPLAAEFAFLRGFVS